MDFVSYLKTILEVSASLEADLNHVLRTENLPKKYRLHNEGKICRRVYFIEKGLARSFYYDKDGRDITGWFAAENSFTTAVDSFFQQQPSKLFLELLEDSIVHSLTFDEVENLYAKFPEMERFGRLMLLEVFTKTVNRVNAMQFQTAQERYRSFAENYPDILQRASLGHIASFLGITQETLSRIRAKG